MTYQEAIAMVKLRQQLSVASCRLREVSGQGRFKRDGCMSGPYDLWCCHRGSSSMTGTTVITTTKLQATFLHLPTLENGRLSQTVHFQFCCLGVHTYLGQKAQQPP